MKTLDKDWMTRGTLDFEYKKYVLLDYLQHVKRSFERNVLYPDFSELIFHHRNARQVLDQKKHIQYFLPKELVAIDIKHAQLHYRQMNPDARELQIVEDIARYALQQLDQGIANGKTLFNLVNQQVSIEPVGVKALEDTEGLLMIDSLYDRFYHIYHYKMSHLRPLSGEGVQTTLLSRLRKSVNTNIEQLKLLVLNKIKLVSNFSTFRVVSESPFPIEATLLPVVKFKFMDYLNSRGVKTLL